MANLAESLPIYIRITEGVKDYILSGELKEESQLPSTTYLSKEYISNHTILSEIIRVL